MEEIEQQKIAARLDLAKRAFIESEAELLNVGANERSMTHKFAEHLQHVFPEYHVDCEYNRDGLDPKRLRGLRPPRRPRPDDTDALTVFPDIIVHRRGTACNLLVIEAKKDDGDQSFDCEKLEAFVEDPHYGYRYAYLLRFITGSNPDVVMAPFDEPLRRFVRNRRPGK